MLRCWSCRKEIVTPPSWEVRLLEESHAYEWNFCSATCVKQWIVKKVEPEQRKLPLKEK